MFRTSGQLAAWYKGVVGYTADGSSENEWILEEEVGSAIKTSWNFVGQAITILHSKRERVTNSN